MKIAQLAEAAARVADRDGWGAVSSAAVARELQVHSVSVSRTASKAEIEQAAKLGVRAFPQTYPRAALELRLQGMTHAGRVTVFHFAEGIPK